MVYFYKMKNITLFIPFLVFFTSQCLLFSLQKITLRRIKGIYFIAFHVTNPINSDSILKVGLLPNKRYSPSGTDPAISYFDTYFEPYKPPHLPSRQKANFFFLTAKEAEQFAQQTKNPYTSHKIILKVKINPESAYVLEADFKYEAFKILEVASRLNEFGRNEYKRFINEHRTELEQSIKSYWKSAIKLAEFLQYYIFDGEIWRKNPGAPQDLPEKYISPEIIYPDSVPPENIEAPEEHD